MLLKRIDGSFDYKTWPPSNTLEGKVFFGYIRARVWVEYYKDLGKGQHASIQKPLEQDWTMFFDYFGSLRFHSLSQDFSYNLSTMPDVERYRKKGWVIHGGVTPYLSIPGGGYFPRINIPRITMEPYDFTGCMVWCRQSLIQTFRNFEMEKAIEQDLTKKSSKFSGPVGKEQVKEALDELKRRST